jgi:hypothetical protein
MPWPKSDASNALEEKLEKIMNVSPSPPVIVYLEAVYGLRHSAKPKTRKRLQASAPKGIRNNLIRQIIEVTTRKHVSSKMKGRYANALRWAMKNKISPQNLSRFIKAQGGIGACAQKFLDTRKRRGASNKSW